MVAAPAHAQVASSTLEGHVDGAKAGTQVVATDNNTGQRLTGTVDAAGNYSILGVNPSTYTVTVDGREPQQTQVLVGQSAIVDFVEASASSGAGGGIVVTGRRSRQPVTAQAVATNITPAQIENLPQNRRNFLSFAALAPGLQVTPGGNAQIQAGALASSNVNVLLDGLSFKNPINHGGVVGQNFGLGNPFPQIAVQEYQVQTQNFGAETGQAGSAVLSAITKTGGNEFHGSAFIEFQPKAFITRPYFEHPGRRLNPGFPCPDDATQTCYNEKGDYNRKQFGGEIGGPIIKDKLTFYLAAEATNQSLPGSSGVLRQPFPQNVQSQILVPRSFDFKQRLYFGKLTFFATDNDTLNASYYRRREDNLSDVDDVAAPEHGRRILTEQDRYQLNWRHSAGDFLNQLNMAYDKGTQATPRVSEGPQFTVTSTQCPDPSCETWSYTGPGSLSPQYSTGIDGQFAYLGAHFFVQGDKQKGIFIRDDMTLRRGEHTIKWGGEVNFLKLARRVENFTQPGFFYFNPGPTGTFDQFTQQPDVGVIATGPNPELSLKDTQIGVYIQDEWKPDQHWTINAGIRWDFESNANNNDYVTPQRIADALRAYPGWAARGIDPEDYISTGNNRDPFYGAFAPRLGVSYDVHGDRDIVIFGGLGRYYDRNLFIQGAIETITNENYITPVVFCPPGTAAPAGGNGSSTANCAAFDPAMLSNPELLRAVAASQGIGNSVFLLDNKMKTPFSDQFDIGVRKRFGQIQTSLTFSHISSHNISMFARANFFENGWYTRFVTRDANGNVTGCTNGGDAWIQDSIPGGLTNQDGSPVPTSICAAQNGQLAGFNGKLNRMLNNGKARYNAIYVTAEKPFTDASTWGFTTALTLQRARSNVAQELNSDEFYNGVALDDYGWNNVNGVPKWNWVTSGTWRAPYDIILSGILTLNSGPAFGNIIFGNNPDGSCCYANLGGPLWPKKDIAYKRLDLRVAKTFKLPWGHEFTAEFEAFNVFNWLNRNYPSWDAGGGANPPRTFDDQVSNDARAFQAGLRYKF
ncbi:TonB-dependent receptor [Sphingomonas sp. SM33]|uniref:TonB-dependent receptor n=1 Tax=Sphingomonas telluris TaxID=2907998 RepID=A0ABS9VMD0_9SPHN|nr:TonB-dependent receptor [Sphingomonas telluris]MCH8616125.1 TonB-dependent receptor [Sphingomonas telluris]